MTTTTSRRPAKPSPTSQRPLLLAAGTGYSLAWLIGLTLVSSSTQVQSTGTQVARSYAGQQGAAAIQYVLTEGVAGILLAAVVWSLARSVQSRARAWKRLILGGGLSGAALSVAQCGLGLWLSLDLVTQQQTGTTATVLRLINRFDGVKMLLFAIMAVATAAAVRRQLVPLAHWLGYSAAVLAITITLSGIGYLALNDRFAAAAWISLPCLLVFVTGTAVTLALCPNCLRPMGARACPTLR